MKPGMLAKSDIEDKQEMFDTDTTRKLSTESRGGPPHRPVTGSTDPLVSRVATALNGRHAAFMVDDV